jgi:hypothetical protein
MSILNAPRRMATDAERDAAAHRDLVGMADDMTVGDDEPAARVEHHAGAEGMNFVPSRERDALARLLLRAGLRREAAPAFDDDHGRRDPLHHRGEAGYAGGLGDDGQRHARMGNGACGKPEAERDRRADPSSNQATTLASQMIHTIQELSGQTLSTSTRSAGVSASRLWA